MTDPGQPCVMISGNAFSMPGPDVDEVDIDPVDLSYVLRQGVKFRLYLAPIVICCPIAGERLQRHQLHSLRPVSDELSLEGQRVVFMRLRNSESSASGNIHTKRTNVRVTASRVLQLLL